MRTDAVMSECGRYRYDLRRTWDETQEPAVFIMLNPSTADAELDDPTIRRCIGFARSWGHGGIVVANLYAFRATQPADLWKTADPVGPQNDWTLHDIFFYARLRGRPLVAAWGAHARADRVAEVLSLAALCKVQLAALGLTKSGAPRHPLYMRADSQLSAWRA